MSSNKINTAVVPYAIWFLIYFVTTEGYGLRMESWGGLGSASVGWFGALQILLTIISLVMLPKGLKDLIIGFRTQMGVAILILAIAMPIYLIFITLVTGAFKGGVQLTEAIRNIMMIKPLLLLFLFAALMSGSGGLRIASNMLAANALIAAIAIIAIVGLQMETAVVSFSLSNNVTRLFRAIYPTALLVASGWLLFLSRYLIRGGRATLAASVICLFSTVIQMHRSALIAISVVLVLLLARLVTARLEVHSGRRWSLFGIIAAIVIAPLYYLGASEVAWSFASSAFIELFSSSGNSGHRFLLIENSFGYILDRFGFGVGLDWELVEDFSGYLLAAFVAGPTLDSTYANILIVYGIPGVLLYSWIAGELFRLGGPRQWLNLTSVEKEMSLFVRPFLAYCLVVGLGTDVIVLSSSSVVFATFLMMAFRLRRR